MNEKILEELKRHADLMINVMRINLSNPMTNQIQSILVESVIRMERENRTSDRDVEIAKEAVGKLIRGMNGNREHRSFQWTDVSQNAVSFSKSTICPLWPIC